MDLSRRGITRSVVRRVNSFGATPISSRNLVARATRFGDRDGAGALRESVGGKVVLVTGASSGIGRAAALRLAGAGATPRSRPRSWQPVARRTPTAVT
jgi:hypothetical protein